MKRLMTYLVMVTYLAWGFNSAARASATTLEHWQTHMIYQPNESVPERESKSIVHIYDGFGEIQVDQALNPDSSAWIT